LYEVTALLRSRGPLAYILILIAETESYIRGLDDVEQGGLSIRMVAGIAKQLKEKYF
jgi:hypothetical protein